MVSTVGKDPIKEPVGVWLIMADTRFHFLLPTLCVVPHGYFMCRQVDTVVIVNVTCKSLLSTL